MDSYRYIGTFATDSGNLWNWDGPVSSVAFVAPGSLTGWGTGFGVSAFDMGRAFGTGSISVLNTTSGFGSAELDLTSLLSTIGSGSFGVSNAPVFNWNGDPANPGFGCDTFSLSGGYYTDTLASSDWGLVQNYELYLNSTDINGPRSSINQVVVSNFQDINIKTDSSVNLVVNQVQRGSFDLTHGGGLTLSTAAPAGTTSQSTFVVQGGGFQTSVSLQSASPLSSVAFATTDYAGHTLVTDGSTSLLDFYTGGGADDVLLSASNISSNLAVSGGSANLTFLANNGNIAFFNGHLFSTAGEYGTGLVELNPAGTQVSSISTTDAGGLTIVSGFQFGRDMIDMALAGTISS
jgi:hypothetical protein